MEVEPEEVAAAGGSAEGVASAATVSPPPGLEHPNQAQDGHEAQEDQADVDAGAGDSAPADAEQQKARAEEEESDIVADFAPEGAGAPEEFPLTTGDSSEAESEHPLAYHPISRVLASPTILRPAISG